MNPSTAGKRAPHFALLPPGVLTLEDGAVEERVRWASRRGQPGWLWPDVEPAHWQSGLGAVTEALGAHLEGAPHVRLPVPHDATPLALAIACFTSGTGALFGRWWEEGTLDTPPEVGDALALHLEHGRRRWGRLRAATAQAVDVLAEIGLRPVILKGVHTAAAFYPEPACRPCSDVDLAVPVTEWPRAVNALVRAGYAPLTHQARLGRVELLPPGEGSSLHSLHLLHHDAPIRVDVHAGLDRAFFGVGRLALGDPTAHETSPWPAVHPEALVLREPLLLATIAAHASEGLQNLTLIRMHELVRVIRVGSAQGVLDWDALLARVGRGGLRFLFPALEMTERLAPGTVPGAVRAALRAEAPPSMRHVVDELRPATTQRIARLSLEERLMWAGSPTELVGRLADMAWPASAGGSWRRVAQIYADRLWRVVRGRVSLGT